ncbi:MAG TPA: hypothetical protein GX706_03630, partial [Candidatus Moranbacteria bacterium]|nr:hypothetical protein [Candidatus Moranbacteria bacterium]
MGKNKQKNNKYKRAGKSRGVKVNFKTITEKNEVKQVERISKGKKILKSLIFALLIVVLLKTVQVAFLKIKIKLEKEIHAEQIIHWEKIRNYAEQLKTENLYLRDNFFAELNDNKKAPKFDKEEHQFKVREIQKSLNQIEKVAEQIRREFVYYDNDLSVHLLNLKSQELEGNIYLAWIVPQLADRLVRSVEYELYFLEKESELTK